MKTLFFVYLFVLWTFFWSFASVVIDRIKNKKSWIIAWRSECPKCLHKLWIFDLIPVFSFLFSFWKCKYCKSKISYMYLFLELSMWIVFLLTWFFLVDFDLILFWNIWEIFRLIFFLFFWFFTIVYVFYDILYLEIPESILLALMFLISIFLSFGLSWEFLDILWMWFYFLCLAWFYAIMLLEMSIKKDFLILFWLAFLYLILKFYFQIDLEKSVFWEFILWSFIVFLFLFLQIAVSNWAWMWWWDLRIALVSWIVWLKMIFPFIFVVYLVWSFISIFVLLFQKIKFKKSKINTQIPFWPFLAIWMYICLIFQDNLKTFLENIFI